MEYDRSTVGDAAVPAVGLGTTGLDLDASDAARIDAVDRERDLFPE